MRAPFDDAELIYSYTRKDALGDGEQIDVSEIARVLVPVETEPLSDGTCRIVAHRPIEYPTGAEAAEIAQRCWEHFETMIVARPHHYLWAYKHFRYKPSNASFYANYSTKFDKLSRATAQCETRPS